MIEGNGNENQSQSRDVLMMILTVRDVLMSETN